MSNFLGEVLQAKGNATFEELNDALRNLESKISQMKISVIQSLNSTFVLSETDIDRVVQWYTEILDVSNCLDELESQLEKDKQVLHVAHQDLADVKLDLEISRESIALLKVLVEIVSSLERADPSDYFHASQLIKTAETELSSLIRVFPGCEDHIWIKQLRARFSDLVVDVYDKCRREWGSVFKFDKNDLHINPHAAKISHVVQSLKNVKSFTRIWEKFVNLLWQELFKPACSRDYQIQVVSPNVLNDADMFPVKVKGERPAFNGDVSLFGDALGNDCSEVIIKAVKLEKPYEVSHVLFQNLTELVRTINSVFTECDEELSNISYVLGSKINQELSTKYLRTLVLHKCGRDVENAREEVGIMKKFVENLEYNYRFTFPEGSTFEDIESNFESFFENQVREALIVKIRELIKSDLHNTCETKPEAVPNSAVSSSEIILLRKNPAMFPKCVISKSILEMVNLLKDHLKTYPNDADIGPSVFDLYVALVKIPKHEADAGELVPLTSVLIHNNSLFLAHHAGYTFEMCDDSIPELRTKASQAIAFMMRCVRSKLNELISTAMSSIEERVDRNIDITHDFLVITAELKRLNSVMIGVLPASRWMDILATLVDHTVNEICSKVLAWDDISANVASELATAFTQFAVATSSLFKGDASTPREVEALTARAVKKWQRFRLLIFVLTASMKEIETKWVQGCGPLAIDYTPEEVRRLVRALFQNTDRRAAFLATIK